MKYLSKEKLEDLLYNGDLELDELIELKKNMNNFDFNESEKEAINDGYEPFNFEEELLEEDDYYFEDNV